jgi:putative pyrroloquinoline-quinone binding quinoprotein
MPFLRPLLWSAVLAVGLVVGCGGGNSGSSAGATVVTDSPAATTTAPAKTTRRAGDWTRFGYDAARTNHAPHGISAAKVGRLSEKRVQIAGTVDSSPIYFSRVRVKGRTRELLVMTTTYGKTLGVDAATGATLWTFTPSAYSRVKGSAQITTATPVADPSDRYVFAASSDGLIHKLRVSNGSQVRSGHWPVSITRNSSHEKIASSLNLDGRYVLVTTGGYIGDAPPYQGKVVAIDRSSGRILHVFNSLCSNRRAIINPSTCSAQESAIWGRAGAVVDPVTHRVYATSSNGPWNGSTNWGDSVLELSPGVGRFLRHFTPATQKQLEASDTDLGSTSPALLPDPNGGRTAAFLLQGGKDAQLHLLNLETSLFGVTGSAGTRLGGEAQVIPVVGHTDVFTAPAVLHRKGLTEAFVATGGGTGAYKLVGGRLQPAWQNGNAGTSPVLAGGLLWVYDPSGGLNVYRPSSGKLIRHLPAPAGHWNSPIVAGGRVYLPSGNSNDHSTSGVLSIYH